jgi:hypothetical protein
MMYICGIDPGTTETAIVIINRELTKIIFHDKINNELLLNMIRRQTQPILSNSYIAIERPTPYGKKVGTEVFDTIWFGGFLSGVINNEFGSKVTEISRKKVLGTLLHNAAIKSPDSHVRRFLIESGYAKKGELANDEWAALAVAVTYNKLFIGGNNVSKR